MECRPPLRLPTSHVLVDVDRRSHSLTKTFEFVCSNAPQITARSLSRGSGSSDKNTNLFVIVFGPSGLFRGPFRGLHLASTSAEQRMKAEQGFSIDCVNAKDAVNKRSSYHDQQARTDSEHAAKRQRVSKSCSDKLIVDPVQHSGPIGEEKEELLHEQGREEHEAEGQEAWRHHGERQQQGRQQQPHAASGSGGAKGQPEDWIALVGAVRPTAWGPGMAERRRASLSEMLLLPGSLASPSAWCCFEYYLKALRP